MGKAQAGNTQRDLECCPTGRWQLGLHKVGTRRTKINPDTDYTAIFDLVGHLKEQGIQNVHVLGILKRSCKADPNKTRSQMNGASNPPPRRKDACKPGENDSIRLVNDALRQNEEVHRYKFVGVGDLCSRSFYKPDGVQLNSTGVSRLAKILRKSCL